MCAVAESPMVEQYWKQVVGERMQYTRVVVPRSQEQPLPYGATKLTRAAYEAEIGALAEPPEHAPTAGVVRMVDSRAAGDPRAELEALGLSSGTIDVLLEGANRA